MSIWLIRSSARPIRTLTSYLIRKRPGSNVELWLYFAGFDMDALSRPTQPGPHETRPF